MAGFLTRKDEHRWPNACIALQRSRATSRTRFSRADGIEIRSVIHTDWYIVDRIQTKVLFVKLLHRALHEGHAKNCLPRDAKMYMYRHIRTNRIPRESKLSDQWHFCPSPCPTAPSNSAPRSQWSAMFTSFCERPRGVCVVQCTSTDPILCTHIISQNIIYNGPLRSGRSIPNKTSHIPRSSLHGASWPHSPPQSR